MRLRVIVLLGIAASLGCGAKAAVGSDAGGTNDAGQAIGPSGGTVTLSDGTSVEIPAGALAAPTAITITPDPSAPPPDGGTWVGTPYLFGPEGTQFASPVTLTLAFAPAQVPAGLAAAGIALFTAPQGSTSYVALATTVVDASHVQATTTHFSVVGPAHEGCWAGSGAGAFGSCDTGSSCCTTGEGPYEGYCAVLTTDSANCGSCGNACLDSRQGSDCCGSKCTSKSSDVDNCGVCGTTCTGVMPGCCGAQCTDLATDVLNCGTCSNQCGLSSQCCGGKCVSLTDASNCLGCGMTCSGLCCGPESADGFQGGCTDPLSDPLNCNSCGHECTGPTPLCVGGACVGAGSSSGSSSTGGTSGGSSSGSSTGATTTGGSSGSAGGSSSGGAACSVQPGYACTSASQCCSPYGSVGYQCRQVAIPVEGLGTGTDCCLPAGNACANGDACCAGYCGGEGTCECGVASAPGAGDPCVVTQDCCGGTCVKNTCQCFTPGSACNSIADCCADACDAGICCNVAEDTCTSAQQCCAGMSCRGSGVPNQPLGTLNCCVEQGNPCIGFFDCCGTMSCIGGACQCIPVGQGPCDTDADCCAGGHCKTTGSGGTSCQ